MLLRGSSQESAADAKKTLTEAEAKAKIDDLKKQIEAGADFGKLAKENSDDKDSAAKDGDFGLIKKNSPYPEAIKKTVFELKPGQVSEPLRSRTDSTWSAWRKAIRFPTIRSGCKLMKS